MAPYDPEEKYEKDEGKSVFGVIVHSFFVVPFLIAVFSVLLFAAVRILTVEEHTVVGGLGSAVAELIVESDFVQAKRLRRLGIPDVFPHMYGSQSDHMAQFGINAEGIVRTAEDLTRRRVRLTVAQ